MQASAEASSLDLQAMQSMEWLFKKERIYLLAQFWQQRATLAEKEASSLKEQLAAKNDGKIKTEGQPLSQNAEQTQDASNPRRTPNSNHEQELQAKDREISRLMDEVSRLQMSLQRLQETSAQATARLEEELEARRQHISRLESKLDRQKDYEELKREISVLRSVDLSQIPTGEPGKSLEQVLMERSKALQQAETLKPPSTPDTLGGLSSPLQRAATASPHGAVIAPPSSSLVSSQSSLPSRSTPTPSSAATSTSSSLLFPPPLQNVETFGSFLGEEIVANWRRSLERSIMSQQQQQQQQQQQPTSQASTVGLHPAGAPASTLNHLPSPTDPISSSSTPAKASTPLGSAAALDSAEKATTPVSGHETPAPPTPSSTTTLTSPPMLQAPADGAPPVNGPAGTPAPKSPPEESACHNNNNSHHLANNNIGGLGVLDSLKSPFRFDERPHHFRFGDEFGPVMAGRLGESLIPKGDPMEARLQDMLRYNMDKYASQNLDTLHIARRVRELLSIHNIGQRLFAKYVLGLSQGTVSELLSKPKPWDKLTEKGRDSYRKMHGWACDDNAVLLLKSLIPKKGKEQGMPAFARGPQEGGGAAAAGPGGNGNGTGSGSAAGPAPPDMSEERMAQILSDAGHMQLGRQSEPDTSNDTDSKSPSRLNCPSPFGKDRSLDSQNRRLKKYENDDISQEKVARIYHEELAKITGRRVEDLRAPRDFPASGQNLQGMERTQEEIRMVLDSYHREMQKLNVAQGLPYPPQISGLLALQQHAIQQHHLSTNGGAAAGAGSAAAAIAAAQDLSLGNILRSKMINGVSEEEKEKMEEAMRHAGSAFSLVKPKQEPTGAQSTPGGSSASSPLGNSILPAAMAPAEEFTGTAAASPLQRMASITNSLISQPSTPTHHAANQRPLKAVLPPITQQQFDIYNNLNTEDIVKKVKEQLSQYSISQRLFGESVLGLSQGSVSDLLARPKPWHMLTQKGREPFIRMKMFLEDDNAVHKLVASQYKIAPEKLMRTGGYGGLPPCGTPMKPMLPAKLAQEQMQSMAKAQAAAQVAAQAAAAAQHQESQLQLGPPQQSPQHPSHTQPSPMMLTPPGPILPHGQINVQELQKKQQQHQQQQQQQQPHQGVQMNLHSPHHQLAPSPLRGLHPHISQSVYEAATFTPDLDTQTLTTKIKEALLANNIGQKIFGESVLGLSQGSVSELLSKPKPWHMLSIKGREPFIRMQFWLADPHNVDRLQALKNERREANKKRRSSGPGHDNSSDTSSNDTAEFYHAASPGPGPTSAKKQRVLFSEEQKEALRLAFALDPYPNVATIEFLASELGLSSRTITNWFHNHRMRLKQQPPHGQPEPQSPREPGQPFDPVQFRLLLNQRLLDIQKERLGLGNVPLAYPPYFNPNLAALVGSALKEQCSGLDLSMGSLKREPNQEFEDEDAEDAMSNLGSEDSEGSAGSIKREPTEAPAPANTSRSNRRKPAAPQWVNPEWQEPARTGDEVIINGVCVMQTDDYGVKREAEETVRVEPTPVQDRYEEDAQSDVSSVSAANAPDRESPSPSPKSAQNSPATSPRPPSAPQPPEESPKDIVKHEPEETWDY